MYKVTLILPDTKEGMENLEIRFAKLLADITCKRLNTVELGTLINRLESKKQ
jgi:hypothetical protein